MAKILVTGGCGYIGTHTLVDLVENGYEAKGPYYLASFSKNVISKNNIHF